MFGRPCPFADGVAKDWAPTPFSEVPVVRFWHSRPFVDGGAVGFGRSCPSLEGIWGDVGFRFLAWRGRYGSGVRALLRGLWCGLGVRALLRMGSCKVCAPMPFRGRDGYVRAFVLFCGWGDLGGCGRSPHFLMG